MPTSLDHPWLANRTVSSWHTKTIGIAMKSATSIVVCGIYIDLNQIRAGEATTPESSTHTSAYNRIVARHQRHALAKSKCDDQWAADGWLCELTIDVRKNSHDPSAVRSPTARRASDKGLIPMTLDDYLRLLDASGRIVRNDKRGAIPAEIAPILERLGIQTDL